MKLESGRKYLWQWELNQQLIVPEGCTQVHFANGTSEQALVVNVVNGMANIPNILLKVAATVRCYAWDGDEVITQISLDVLPREKPSDYIYTETEVRRYDILLEELEKKGAYYTPAVDAEGNLSWKKSMERMPDVPGGNIRGPEGPKGDKGDPGTALIDNSVVGDSAWSSKNTVDKLCPYFTESGNTVVCEPVEGYPLEVVSKIPADVGVSKITLYHSNEYESYEYTVDFHDTYSNGRYDWTTGELTTEDEGVIQFAPKVITAFYGVNTFYSSVGDTTVYGQLDPNKHWAEKLAEQEAINEELTAEVEALQAEQNKQYELIEDVTLDEDIANFIRKADPSGNKYNFSAIRIFIRTPVCATTAQVIFSIGSGSSTSYVYHQQNDILTKDTECDALFVERNDNGFVEYFCASYPKNQSAIMRLRPAYNIKVWQNVTRVSISANSSTATIPAGTNIKIYGIRG